jgi:hypothetical protein
VREIDNPRSENVSHLTDGPGSRLERFLSRLSEACGHGPILEKELATEAAFAAKLENWLAQRSKR